MAKTRRPVKFLVWKRVVNVIENLPTKKSLLLPRNVLFSLDVCKCTVEGLLQCFLNRYKMIPLIHGEVLVLSSNAERVILSRVQRKP